MIPLPAQTLSLSQNHLRRMQNREGSPATSHKKQVRSVPKTSFSVPPRERTVVLVLKATFLTAPLGPLRLLLGDRGARFLLGDRRTGCRSPFPPLLLLLELPFRLERSSLLGTPGVAGPSCPSWGKPAAPRPSPRVAPSSLSCPESSPCFCSSLPGCCEAQQAWWNATVDEPQYIGWDRESES